MCSILGLGFRVPTSCLPQHGAEHASSMHGIKIVECSSQEEEAACSQDADRLGQVRPSCGGGVDTPMRSEYRN